MPNKSEFYAHAKITRISDTGAECVVRDCPWFWNGEATFANAANAARSHTKATGHPTHWSDCRDGYFVGRERDA